MRQSRQAETVQCLPTGVVLLAGVPGKQQHRTPLSPTILRAFLLLNRFLQFHTNSSFFA
jgi:hypothetical protein